MFEITGKVQLQGRSVGIPDLVVVAYDADQLGSEWIGTFSAAPTAAPTAPPSPGPDRIGSVMTGPDGSFALKFTAEEFADAPGERRPDLVLLVLAPDRPAAPGSWTPLALGERILFANRAPILRAGRQEAFVVRLPPEVLEAHGIALPAGARPGPTPAGKRTLAALERSTELETTLRASLRDRVVPKLAASRVARTLADTAFERFSLSRFTADERASLAYHAGGPIAPTLTAIAERTATTWLSEGRRVTLQLLLTPDEIAGLGLDPTGSGSRPYRDVQELVDDALTSTVLLPPSIHRHAAADEVVAAELAELIGAPPGAAPPPLDALPLPEPIPVDQVIDRLVRDTTSPETQVQFLPQARADRDAVDREIQAFEIRGGPTDVTSYHDFHELQLAFEHVWTELFDSRVVGTGKRLYEAWVHLQNEVSGTGPEDPPAMSVESEEQLADLTRELERLHGDLVSMNPPPALVRELVPELGASTWNALDATDQVVVVSLAEEAEALRSVPDDAYPPQAREAAAALYGRMIAELAGRARAILERAEEVRPRWMTLAEELHRNLLEPHRFDVFAPDAVNFGLLLDYRQRWKPLSYQVGDLVSTLPLSPKEVRKYSKKTVVKKKRADKEIENALRVRKEDASDTARSDAEIVQRATDKTNFSANVQGGFNLGVGTVNVGTRFGHEGDRQSSSTKKDFREAVLKAAEEFRHERKTEISFESSSELEQTESAEITNPNEELTVTYLFYELQRQYELDEELHRIGPVVLVANHVPAPHEIDETWLVAHEWILRRTLLDDALKPAFEYLREGFTGDQVALDALRLTWQKQKDLVDKLESMTEAQQSVRDELRDRLISTTERQGRAESTELSRDEKIAADILDPLGLFHDTDAVLTADLIEAEQEAIKARLAHAEGAVVDSQKRLGLALSSLESATRAYTEAAVRQSNKGTVIAQLRTHVKENILYYMQAIWVHEPPDQRYLRLYNVTVPWMDVPEARLDSMVHFRPSSDVASERWQVFRELGITDLHPIDVEIEFPATVPVRPRKLVEVADLDRLLGFKGNYMMFPLTEPHYITSFMRLGHLAHTSDGDGVLRDPDELGNLSWDEALELAAGVHARDPDGFAANRELWERFLRRYQLATTTQANRVVVPTESLFIEALPGKHPILEDFKLIHRALDVKKVQAEVRHAELENMRLAARLAADELADPDVDKQILVDGDGRVGVDV